jgi:hypothetical protein
MTLLLICRLGDACYAGVKKIAASRVTTCNTLYVLTS